MQGKGKTATSQEQTIAPSSHALYEVHRTIRKRCYQKDYKDYGNYGGRGIKVCKEWLGEDGYMNFYEWALSHGYKPGLTIDRVCNNRGYSPYNCRWVSRKTQANNRRTNTKVTLGTETHTIAQWCRIKGLNESTVVERIRRGMDPVKAITKPAREYHWKK